MQIQILEAPDESLFARTNRPKPESTPLAVHQAVSTLPHVAQALASNHVVRILNPEVLAKGTLLETATGKLGSVSDGKNIVAQLRLGDAGELQALAGAAGAFQLAAAITGQYYLEQINRKLASIDQQVNAIKQQLDNKTYGKVRSAAETCAELEETLNETFRLTDRDQAKLVEAEGKVSEAYHELVKNLGDFTSDIERTLGADFDQVDKKELDRLFLEGSGSRLYQAQLLVFAAAVRHKLNALGAIVERDSESGRASLFERRVETEHAEMLSELLAVFRAFDMLALPEQQMKSRWRILGGPKAAGEFYNASRQIRSVVESAPRDLLPPFELAPGIIELRTSPNGELEMAHAEFPDRPTGAQTNFPRARNKVFKEEGETAYFVEDAGSFRTKSSAMKALRELETPADE